MITEDYVSFETAKLLKERGFVQPLICQCQVYNPQGGYELTEETIYAPTQALAMKWLREVHKLHIWIAHKLKQNKGLPWYYEIHNIETGTVAKIGDVVCGSYEVACEAAIKYCLENLI